MTKFEELQNSKIRTVGELINKLREYSPETKLITIDCDIGGYDVSSAPYLVIRKIDDNTIEFGHLEYFSYRLFKEKILTFEEHETIVYANQ